MDDYYFDQSAAASSLPPTPRPSSPPKPKAQRLPASATYQERKAYYEANATGWSLLLGFAIMLAIVAFAIWFAWGFFHPSQYQSCVNSQRTAGLSEDACHGLKGDPSS